MIEAFADATSVAPYERLRIYARTTTERGQVTAAVRVFRCPRSPKLGAPAGDAPVVSEATMEVGYQEAGDPLTGCEWRYVTTLRVGAWRSGLYMARVGDDASGSDIYFVVRRDLQQFPAELLVQVPFTTVHAYNTWGGKAFYANDGAEVVSQLSFRRPMPFHQVMDGGHGPLRPLLDWLERNHGAGCIPAADYISSIDLANGSYPIMPAQYRLFLTAGHDEFWSDTMMHNVYNFIADQGNNAAFLGGNIAYKRVVFSDDFTIMHYPSQGDLWAAHDNMDLRLAGLRVPDHGSAQTNFSEPYEILQPHHWALSGADDQRFGIHSSTTIIGYEVDQLRPESPNFEVLARANYNDSVETQFGVFYNRGAVFSAGTIGWSNGLAASEHGRGVDIVTRNVIRRFARSTPWTPR